MTLIGFLFSTFDQYICLCFFEGSLGQQGWHSVGSHNEPPHSKTFSRIQLPLLKNLAVVLGCQVDRKHCCFLRTRNACLCKWEKMVFGLYSLIFIFVALNECEYPWASLLWEKPVKGWSIMVGINSPEEPMNLLEDDSGPGAWRGEHVAVSRVLWKYVWSLATLGNLV